MKLLAALLRARPDFFIIGAMKSGTTSLYQYLNFHSRVESSLIKEPCYYSYNYNRGKDWYLAQFPEKKLFGPRHWYFDASPVYLHDSQAARRMYRDYPKARLIVILRDPIERAVSHYNYYSSKDSNFGRKPENRIDERTLDEAFRDDMAGRETREFFRYCRMSLYAQQISSFLACYPREQLLFVDLKELECDVLATLLRIADFLRLPAREEFAGIAVSEDRVDSQASFQKVTDRQFRKFNALDYDIPVPDDLRAALVAFFHDDVQQLQTIAGRTFSWAAAYQPGQ